MSTAIAIVGPSGSGKSTGIRTLDPATTLLINCDMKSLSWPKWKSQYNKENNNYVVTVDPDKIAFIMEAANSKPELAHIKVIVIDTVNAVMVDDMMSRLKKPGYDKWMDLAQIVWDIVNRASELRDDIIVLCLFHSEKATEDHPTRIKTSGRMLRGLEPETRFSIVLHASPRLTAEGKVSYGLDTSWNNSTAKSPIGLFPEPFIPNDYKTIVDAVRAYEQ